MKAEATSGGFRGLIKQVTQAAAEDTAVRSNIQRILIKLLGI